MNVDDLQCPLTNHRKLLEEWVARSPDHLRKPEFKLQKLLQNDEVATHPFRSTNDCGSS